MSYDESKKEFIKTIEDIGYKYQKWEVFNDFCNIAAISLYQPFAQNRELEKEYLSIINKYEKTEINMFPRLLSYIVNALTDRLGDFLGECFMSLDLGSKYKGQFFTPYYVSSFMSDILGVNDYERMSEPCSGSGGMIIARADTLLKNGVNYQDKMLVQAVDVDSLCVNMCYIQLTLLHIPAEVIHGNSLSKEVFKTFYTPAYFIKAANKQFPNWRDEDDKEIQIKVPIERENSNVIYSQEQLATFSTGKLF